MPIFSLPTWAKKHLYKGKNYQNLTEEELDSLKNRLSKFNPGQPDVSIVIPAWNEQDNIFRALSSLADTETNRKVEIVVINNNSTDKTQALLDRLGIRSYIQHKQGTPFARQLGLEVARGKYHLCADSDTLYPVRWVDLMVKPMEELNGVVGVYGRYSFIPAQGKSRSAYVFYEWVTGILIRIRKRKREYINVLGFNMGFITNIARETDGFKVNQVRMFDNALGSEYFVDEAEDGRMAVRLKEKGKLKLVTDPKAKVYTSSRRLEAEGGIFRSFTYRLKTHLSKWQEYLKG